MDVTSLHNRRAVERWERVSVGDMFERLTWSYPDQEAIVARRGAFADPALQRVTYRQADELANQVADRLLAHGLERSDRVLMFCENSVEAYLTKFGIAKAGLTCVPLNPMLAPDVVGYLLDLTEPRFSIVDAELWPKLAGVFAARGIDPRRDDRDRRPARRGLALVRELRRRRVHGRARRRDPRRRRLADHLHVGHDRDAQGRDGHAQLQLPRPATRSRSR